MSRKTPVDIASRSFAFALRIIKLAHFLDAQPGVARTLSKQILRSGTSIGANVEESRAAQSRADFIHKLEIALKEARETVYWLRLISESGVVAHDRVDDLLTEADELSRILGASVVATKKKRNAITTSLILLAAPRLGAFASFQSLLTFDF